MTRGEIAEISCRALPGGVHGRTARARSAEDPEPGPGNSDASRGPRRVTARDRADPGQAIIPIRMVRRGRELHWVVAPRPSCTLLALATAAVQPVPPQARQGRVSPGFPAHTCASRRSSIPKFGPNSNLKVGARPVRLWLWRLAAHATGKNRNRGCPYGCRRCCS
jgi:hypothetical protein